MKNPKDMTDEQLIEAVATEVMGWKMARAYMVGTKGEHCRYHQGKGGVRRFRPLADWNHTMEVVEKSKSSRLNYSMHFDAEDGGIWCVSYGSDLRYGPTVSDQNLQRAICLAALAVVRSLPPHA